jgi:DNA-binding response OmpR family regulator
MAQTGTGRGAGAQTILIVDDDATLRAALESVLTSLGHRVLTASEPEAAYALASVERFDAVLLDVRLRTSSGPALYLTLVHEWPYLERRIAFMTADPDDPGVRSWLELYASTVLRKPFRMDDVTRWLAALAAAAERDRRGRHTAS